MHNGVRTTLALTLLAAFAALTISGCAPAAPTATASVPATASTLVAAAPTAAATMAPATPPTASPTQPAPTVAPTAASTAVEITDDAKRKVTVKSSQKIISLSPANTEILFALGLGDRVVADTEYCDYPAEAKAKPKVGGFSDIDAEKVAALAPDLVVADSLHVSKVVPSLERLGLTVVVIDPKDTSQVLDRINTIGALTGKATEAKALTAQLQKRATDIAAKAKTDASAPRVFWMLGEGLFTAGPGTFVNGLIEQSNGKNIAAGAATQWPELSMEAVLTGDPEVIVIASPDAEALIAKMKVDAAWKGVSAVKNGRFVAVDVNIVARPGPRIVDGLEAVAKGLHPDQFK